MAITATPEQQQQLLELQSLDQQLARVRTQLDEIPKDQQLTTLRRDGARAVEQTKTVEAQVTQDQAALQAAEQAVLETTKRRDGMQQRLDTDQVPTRDVQAVTIEIAELTVRIDTLENTQLEAIQTLEQSQQALEHAQQEVAAAQQAVNERIGALNEQGQQLSKQGKELTAERTLMANSLPADLVREYEQLRDQNQGIGALALTSQGLSGAGLPIAPAELAAIERTPDNQLAYCPDTGAILVRS